jgi:hypothetical protein
LHERAYGVERAEKYGRDYDADSRSSCAGYDWKQTSTKEGLLNDRPQQRVEKNQVPQADYVSGWSRGMGNDVDPNPKPDSGYQGGNKMNPTGPTPSQKRPHIASMSEPYDRVQRAD